MFIEMRRCDKCNLDVPSGTVLTSLCVDEAAHHLVEHEGNIDRHCNKCNVEVLSGSVLESVCVDGVAHTFVESVNGKKEESSNSIVLGINVLS